MDEATGSWGIKVERVEMLVEVILLTSKINLVISAKMQGYLCNCKGQWLQRQKLQERLVQRLLLLRENTRPVERSDKQPRLSWIVRQRCRYEKNTLSGLPGISKFQLRYLQTLNSISAENNSTIVFPMPIETISNFMQMSSDQQQMLQLQHMVTQFEQIKQQNSKEDH